MEQQLDWNAKLVRFFINNSRLVILLIIAIFIGGTFSILNLRREGFPKITPKIVLVQTVFPGASPTEVENQVTQPLESELKDVVGLKEISSTSQNSFSNLIVTINESRDLDTAVQDIQSKVQSVRSILPEDVEAPKVTTASTSGPAFIVGLTRQGAKSDDLRSDATRLSSLLANVSGVKSAELAVPQNKKIVIAYRANDLNQKGINLTTLNQVLQAANVNLPIGNFDINGKEQSVVSVGALSSIDDIKKLIIGATPAGVPVKLTDVATVTEKTVNPDQIERFAYTANGKTTSAEGVLLNITTTSDADVIKTKETVIERIDKARADSEIASSTSAVFLADEAVSTEEQVTEITEGALGAKRNFFLLGGIQLLFIAILLFVNVRAAIIAALSIPLSLGITFMTLYILGIQLNTIVLFSLILVLGLIVDPAIVMIEAIQRYRDLGYRGQESVLESGRRYGASLFMAVLTSLIVFLPFGVVSGIFGQIIKYIPLTVIPALLASYFVPIAILPMLADRWLKPSRHTQGNDEHEGLNWAARFFMTMNSWILAKPWRHVVVLIIALAMVVAATALVPTGKVQIVQFASPEDNPYLQVSAQYDKGLTFAERDQIAQDIESIILREKSVKQLYYASQDRTNVSIFVELNDKSLRSEENQKSKSIVSRLKPEVVKIKGLTDSAVDEIGTGPPTAAYPISTQLYSNDPVKLEAAAKTAGQFLAGLEHVTKVDDGFSNRGEPELEIVLDRTKIEQTGLSSFEVGTQIKSLFDETKVSRFETKNGESLDIFLVNDKAIRTTDEIKQLTLFSRTGQSVQLGDAASIQEVATIDAIQRFDGLRFATVKAKVDDPKNTIIVQQKFDEYLTDAKIKELGLDSRQNKGEFEDIAKSFRDLGIALVVAILLTYLVLVLQFKSFSQPAIMLFTIPLSFIGVFPALWLTKSDLGFLELLGVTILVGIVENVAIFLIDYANQLVAEKGLTPKEAIIQATGVRFRPILLTKLVAFGGLLPLAIESDFWRGLSVVIIAGIGVSGFISLLVIPIFYVWISGLRARVHRQTSKVKIKDMLTDPLIEPRRVPVTSS